MIDPVSETYQRFVTLFAQDGDWAVAPKNFIHYADIQGLQDPDLEVTSDGDYPRALLEGPVSGSSAMATQDATFSRYAAEDDPLNLTPAHDLQTLNYIEQATWDFRLTLWSQTERLDDYGPLLIKTLRVVRNAGARLGLPWVTGVTFRFTCRLVSDSDSEIKRWEITLLLSVKTEIEEAPQDRA